MNNVWIKRHRVHMFRRWDRRRTKSLDKLQNCPGVGGYPDVLGVWRGKDGVLCDGAIVDVHFPP